ncbi:hypothetical protein RHGRI_020772 [Rhododendron griersonianum]|uniref:Uncharacterized protein n=1 Tax=Rhododendron griersonianum TaxID=479676 RepID=A0AAV6JJI0_9ERIC|nr:hypothetical protein RHGRI_020772 [Rhododendron griersonianum]
MSTWPTAKSGSKVAKSSSNGHVDRILKHGSRLFLCCHWLIGLSSVQDKRERLVVRRFKFEEQRLEQIQELEMAPWTRMKLLISFNMAPLSRSVICFTPHIYVDFLDDFTELHFSHHSCFLPIPFVGYIWILRGWRCCVTGCLY